MGFRPATRSEINLASKVAHICTLLGFAILKSSFAWAALDPTLPPGATSSIPKFDLNTIIPASVAGTVLKTLAILTDHRSYEGATPQGLLGFRIGAEATLVHLPNDFGSTLQTLGVGGASTEAVALPIARLHVSKGIGANTDVGISGLYYKGNYIMGGDIKYTFYQPEEGVTWAWRLGYSAT